MGYDNNREHIYLGVISGEGVVVSFLSRWCSNNIVIIDNGSNEQKHIRKMDVLGNL